MRLRRMGLLAAAALAILGAAPMMAAQAEPAGTRPATAAGPGTVRVMSAPPGAVTNDSHYRGSDGCLYPTFTVAIVGHQSAWFDNCSACLKARTMAYVRGTDEYDCALLYTSTLDQPTGFNLLVFGPRFGTPHPIVPW